MRRFIAGATCPRCAKMDKIVVERGEDGSQVRECVSCGFRDVMTDQGPQVELTTRVNQPRVGEKPLAHEDEVQVVTLMDPKQKDDKGPLH